LGDPLCWKGSSPPKLKNSLSHARLVELSVGTEPLYSTAVLPRLGEPHH